MSVTRKQIVHALVHALYLHIMDGDEKDTTCTPPIDEYKESAARGVKDISWSYTCKGKRLLLKP